MLSRWLLHASTINKTYCTPYYAIVPHCFRIALSFVCRVHVSRFVVHVLYVLVTSRLVVEREIVRRFRIHDLSDADRMNLRSSR